MASQKPNLNKNFTLRGESFKDGMLLLIKHLDEQDWKLGNKFSARSNLLSKKIETLYKEFKDDLENEKVCSFEAVNSDFDNLIASYITLLNSHTTLQDPLQSLRDAECCAVWKKGREHFDTHFLVDNTNDRNLESLIIVLSETPYTDSDILQPEYTVLKTWFKSLPTWQQAFISENSETLSKKSIPSSFRGVAGLANVSYHECKVNDVPVLSYFRHATQLPIDLLGQKGTEDEQFRLTCINIASQIRLSLDEKLRHSASSSQEELVILSQSLVSPGVIANAKARFISVASDNDTKIYELKEQAIRLFQHALANPEAKIDDDKIKKIFFPQEENEKDVFYKDLLKKCRLNVQHNYQYKPFKFTLVSTNHPLNTLRHFEVYQPQINNNEKNTALLLDAVARHLKSLLMAKPKVHEIDSWPQLENYLNKYNIINEFNNKLENLIKVLEFREKEKISINRKTALKLIKGLLTSEVKVYLDENTFKLMHALYALLSIPKGQGVLASDKRHKPMLRSTAEIMLINCLKGVAWIACKSGKDRTGGASIAADAAAIYYEQNKKFPLFQDNELDREDYLKIVQKLYISGHHQYQASENAPGAKGLIKSTCFFPSDLKLDASIVLLETELARLNKPKVIVHSKMPKFDHRVLNSDFIDDLQDIKDKTITGALDTNVTLQDWQMNWESYNINGKSVKELRNNKNFKDEQDLSTFIETQLLAQVKNQQLKEYYKALVLYSFHQGGFPHAFSKVSMASVNQYLAEENAIIAQPDVQINFSWSEVLKGIQIEEINTYKEKKGVDTATILLPETGEYYCQTQSCILLNLNEVAKAGAYKLAVSIQSASVDCVDELKPLFFKELNLLEIFIQYLQSLLAAIKQYCDELIKKPGPVMNENWLSKTKLSFFQKLTAVSDDENEVLSSSTKPVL